ncbi:MAG: phosphoribosylamine--glycine ligase [Candidatus Omnitrophica bacterium]|nr:phosphoribosylamine--glycine ligase [Candidatus Omnitrophota bacterium]MBD3269296.1 phosphoribosylamine--glycine ligase [Candidatus Omnitrophota bacterium]
MKVLVIGSGGREHCLAWKISHSLLLSKLYCAPGNGGTHQVGENLDIPADDIEALADFAAKNAIDLTVVGPEAPLVAGVVDKFREKGLAVFGPVKDLAMLEGSKVFAKEVMRKYNIPTADFKVFDDPSSAQKYAKSKDFPLVVKADGLAAGKGVVVCQTPAEAEEAIKLIMVDKKFGDAGRRVIIEEFLEGDELSMLVFTDGETILPLVPSRDHKRAFNGDKGPNTGGMGAFCPVREDLTATLISRIFSPLIKGLASEGKRYKGILYGGLMLKGDEPYVLEFNVRFGDPEIQAILPKLNSDLLEIMEKAVKGRLSEISLNWDERFCLCVVLASGGYPGSYEKGKPIEVPESKSDDVFVFHAGTKGISADSGNTLVTCGGRVLNVVGMGENLEKARSKVYETIEKISFEGMFYREDIGKK